MLQRQARHQQFMAFKEIADALGYSRIKQTELRSRFTLDTDGAQEAAANVAWTAQFMNDSATAPLAQRTLKPKLQDGQALPNEYLMCIRALSLVHNQMITTETETELMEICRKLGGGAVLEGLSGQDSFVERHAGFLLVGVPGIEVREDATNAAAGTPNVNVRGKITKMIEGDDLDDPLVLFPGGSMSWVLHGEGAWTSTDDIPIDLVGHGWIAFKGGVDASGKVGMLSDLIRQKKENIAQLRNRAKLS